MIFQPPTNPIPTAFQPLFLPTPIPPCAVAPARRGAAQERGEVAKAGGDRKINVVDGNVEMTTAADLGLRRDEIHEARKLRDDVRRCDKVI